MRNILFLSLFGFLLWSCGHPTNPPAQQTETIQAEKHHHGDPDEALELDNGEKWLVNDEMKPFVLKGAEIVEQFINERKTDFKELALKLKNQNSGLIESCTMDGKAHDELHKWLHPLLGLVNELDNETDTAKAAEIVNHIHESYNTYNIYFK